MEIARIDVSGHRGRIVSRTAIPAGLVGGFVTIHYDESWAGLHRAVVFKCGGITKDVITDDDRAAVPPEVVALPGLQLMVGVYGTGTDTAIPTLWMNLGCVQPAADPSGDTSTDSSLPVWAQLQLEIEELRSKGIDDEQLTAALEAALEAAQSSGEFDGPQGPQGPAGADGQDGSPGANGPPGEDGKSAYQYAQEGGYSGTEAEFYEDLSNVGSGGGGDLTGYATEQWVQDRFQPKGEYLTDSVLSSAIDTALTQAKESGEFDGPQGPQGPAGPQGSTGDTGPQGPAGAAGADGKDGTSVTVKSVSESTADGGSNVVTFSDGKTITIKNGSKGSTGDTGPQGPAGADGQDGSNGQDGADGTSVTVVSVSESSADGGSNVVTFSDGTTITIKNGSKGSTGDTGPQGPRGEQGIQGDTGATGAAGSNGADGVGIASVEQTTTSTADGGNNVVTVTLTNGTNATFTVKNGSKGSTGATGATGADGYTPVRGTDYWTASDIAEIKSYVDEAILGGAW